jgi:hypothetical protein
VTIHSISSGTTSPSERLFPNHSPLRERQFACSPVYSLHSLDLVLLLLGIPLSPPGPAAPRHGWFFGGAGGEVRAQGMKPRASCVLGRCSATELHSQPWFQHSSWQSLKNFHIRTSLHWAPVAHACNPSYLGGRDQEHQGSKLALANTWWDPILKKTLHKKGLVEWLKV